MSRVFYSALLAAMTVVGFGMTEGPEPVITPSLSKNAEVDDVRVAWIRRACPRCGSFRHEICPTIPPTCGVRG